MALQNAIGFKYLSSTLKGENSCKASSYADLISLHKEKQKKIKVLNSRVECFCFTSPNLLKLPFLDGYNRRIGLRASKVTNEFSVDDGKKEGEEKTIEEDEGPTLMDNEERQEWRRTIREVIDKNPNVEEEEDPIERRKKMQKLLAEYPLVVEEEDPEWPEGEDGWGFNLDQFFNKITIKNVKKDDDDENYDSDKEIVWQDDNYIRPIKDITTKDWEETVFKDISPLVVFVHNRYKRPRENEKVREELEKTAHIFWNCSLPSPRCVAVDAVIELDLVAALKVLVFPEVIFTKAGKILYREKAIRTADELSKIMAFFYYGAARPPYLNEVNNGQELIPTISTNRQHSS